MLISLKNTSFALGGPLLLDEANLEIGENERIALIGRNGSGKSTLFNLINGKYKPDSGELTINKNISISTLQQEVPTELTGKSFDIVAEAFGEKGKQLSEYYNLINADGDADRLTALQSNLDQSNGWQLQTEIETVLKSVSIDNDDLIENLSGGQRRRVLLAKALVTNPDLLLLDEPTNHLDIQSIVWMETFLQNFSGSILFITHDRAFLKQLSTRIIELDRGQLSSWKCDYETFLIRKQTALETEGKHNAVFDKKLAQEETWIRQGIKARRTRNEGRVRKLKELRSSREKRRESSGNAKLQLQGHVKSGSNVIKAKNISFSYGDKLLVDDFSTKISRGDKIGLVGPNGVGKTTLIELLLGNLEPSSGEILIGTKLETLYFDQKRETLDESKTLAYNVAGDNDKVIINGHARHIISYLSDFLFSPIQTRSLVKSLSGGERNRLLLAKLFTKPGNFLILDEPTNDLDMETLELLESLLVDFPGTLLLVSHDRDFLSNVATSTYSFEGNGTIKECTGDFSEVFNPLKSSKNTSNKANGGKKRKQSTPVKLSYKENKLLEELPKTIEKLEEEQRTLSAKLSDPTFYKSAGKQVEDIHSRLQEIESSLEKTFEKWELLESKKS